MIALEEARERRIDELVALEEAAKNEAARAAHRERVLEDERKAREAEELALAVAARDARIAKLQAERGALVAAYPDALAKFLEVYINLAARDQMLELQGFSPSPHLVDLRHTVATPDHAHGLHPLISGSIQDRIIKVIQAWRPR